MQGSKQYEAHRIPVKAHPTQTATSSEGREDEAEERKARTKRQSISSTWDSFLGASGIERLAVGIIHVSSFISFTFHTLSSSLSFLLSPFSCSFSLDERR